MFQFFPHTERAIVAKKEIHRAKKMDLHMQNFLLECMCREHTGQVWPILCHMYVSVEDWVPESENLRFELDNALEQAVDMWNLYATSYTFYSMKTAHTEVDPLPPSHKRMKLC